MKNFISFLEWVDSGAAPIEVSHFPASMWDRIERYLEDDYYNQMEWGALCDLVGYEDLGICEYGGLGF